MFQDQLVKKRKLLIEKISWPSNSNYGVCNRKGSNSNSNSSFVLLFFGAFSIVHYRIQKQLK